MYIKENSASILKKIWLLKNKFFILIIFFIISFILGAYAHKKHFFYTFVKPTIYQNINFLKKNFQGKFTHVEKIYLNIDFKTLKELNNRKDSFIKNNAIDQNENDWLDISIDYKNKSYKAKIRYKGRDTETHLNPSMRSENVSYKIKIKKKRNWKYFGNARI